VRPAQGNADFGHDQQVTIHRPSTHVGAAATRLITLRGSSGSGKSTVAAAVRAARPTGTVAIIGQDVIRRQIVGTGGDQGDHPIALIDLIARELLDRGMDVIIEGIMNASRYANSLMKLVQDHRGVSRSYIWNLSFEETLRRHATKPVAHEFGEAEMRLWWRGFQRGRSRRPIHASKCCGRLM
jgi:predicted kinase